MSNSRQPLSGNRFWQRQYETARTGVALRQPDSAGPLAASIDDREFMAISWAIRKKRSLVQTDQQVWPIACGVAVFIRYRSGIGQGETRTQAGRRAYIWGIAE